MTVPHLRRSPVLDRHTRGIQTDWLVLKLSVVTLVGRRSEYSTKFHKGGAPPRGPTPYIPFYTIFDRKGPPLVYITSVEKWYLFLILSLEFCIFLTAVNALYLKYE